MSRLSTLNAGAATANHVPYALFGAFNFVSGLVNLVTWDQNVTWGGNTYQALGKLANFGDDSEAADLTSSAMTFTLSGVDNSLMSTVLTEKYHNRDAKLWLGYFDQTNTLVDTPYLLWEGFMDSMQIHSDEEVSSISLSVETRLLLLGKTSGWLYSDIHQKQLFPGDGFFNLVARLPNMVVTWGEATPTSPKPASPQVPPSHINGAQPQIPGQRF